MKKIFPLFLLLALQSLTGSAKQVDEATARQAAYGFWSQQSNLPALESKDVLLLNYTSTKNNAVLYYVFSTGNHDFIMISGDDLCSPVLGYSSESGFNSANIPADIAYWFHNYENQIVDIINNASVSNANLVKWSRLTNGIAALGKSTKVTNVPIIKPLVKTVWNQSPYYNIFCPYDVNAQAYSVTGCVATSMAQVMKYWNYPRKGTGSYSYNANFGLQLSANFGATTYNWNAMPYNFISAANDTDAALLAYHAGISVAMNYAAAGSSSQVIDYGGGYPCAESSFVNYFNYKSTTIHGEDRGQYDDSDWMTMLKMELNASRPFIYVGFDATVGGHAWVADGYETNNLIHFNWGWGGSYNGYFSVDLLNPGGSESFVNGQSALMGIAPANPDLTLTLHDNVAVPHVVYNHPFSVSTNIINNSDSAFSGDYVARIYSLDGTAIDSMQPISSMSLASGSNTGKITFTKAASTTLTTGNYILSVGYRPAGKQILEADPTVTFLNDVPFTVYDATSVSNIPAAGTLSVYPNPSSNIINVDLTGINASVATITLTDLQGREITRYNTVKGQLTATIPVKNLAAGNYVVQLKNETTTKTSQITIGH